MIPTERCKTMKGQIDGKDATLVQNSALKDFPHKIQFPRFLYIRIFYRDKLENGLPTADELQVIDTFEAEIAAEIKQNGNAVFVGGATWNGVREIVFQVRDAKLVNHYLTWIIEAEKEPRGFDFEMKNDPHWENADYFFNY